MNTLFARLSEPSSYAGLALVFKGVELCLQGDLQGGLTMALPGLLAFFVPEKK